MTEKKKRGLLSWLGFADEEPAKQEEIEQEEASELPAEPEEVSSDADDSADGEDETAATIQAEEAVAEELSAQPDSEVVQESKTEELQDIDEEVRVDEEPAQPRVQEQEKPTESFFARLKRSLSRTKLNIGAGFFGLFKGKKIDDDLFEELEEQLLIADVGMDTTMKIIDNLTEKASRKAMKDGEALYDLLKEELAEILVNVESPLVVDTAKTPYVILMVGVNGVGKTTTIGKLAKQFQAEGKKVMLAAGDTFRAAAVEQLQVWGERNNVPVVAQHTGADSASVIFDAIESAKAKGVDVVIADTAGRLQNKNNLMEELRKIVRVMKKIDDSAPHEIMLTLDAGTGQNAISQAKLFSDVAPVTGITLTKLDGTAKGGVIFAIADKFGIPIRFIGVGEGIDDLRPFETQQFIDALFSRED